MRLKITGGRVFDPASGWHGETRDLFIEGERLVSRLTTVDRVIEAQGRAVLAGGIDLRGQVATYGLSLLSLWESQPSLSEIGFVYAHMGYTHVHEPFLTPVTAGLVQAQLAALPVVDASASLVLNLRDLDLWLKERDRWPEIVETVRFLQEKTRSLDLRLVEPFVQYRQEFYAHRFLHLAEALEILTRLAVDHGLPLCLEARPEVVQTPFLEPRAFHLGGLGQALLDDDLAAAALRHLEAGVTADCGLALPPAPAVESPPVKVDLGWFQPLNLRPAFPKSQVRRALATVLGHPGTNLAFSALGPRSAKDYPRLFAWLLDRKARQADWDEELSVRQWSLSDWAWATRVLPAKILGLPDRGRLSPGYRADVAVYDLPAEEGTARFPPDALRRVHTLIKAGEVVIDRYQMVNPGVAKAVYFRRTGAQATALLADICQYRSFRTENLWVPEELGGPWVGLQ